MTPQEALKVIDKAHDYPCPYGIGGAAWMYIRNCIEKQIPKKVTHEATLYRCRTCPTCKNVIDEFTDFLDKKVRVCVPHCKFCGQALDWGESE